MKGKELVGEVLRGERNFIGLQLKECFNLSGHEGFDALNRYLQAQEQNLAKEPINISKSVFKFIKAEGLFLPYVKGIEANLRGANLRGAYLREADLERANLWGAYLREADLERADLERADLERADLERADLERADLREANLWGADLWGANLREANLLGANLREANLLGANLREANLWGADLKGTINLIYALNLRYAIFLETKVTTEEIKIIEDALKEKKMFIVE